MSDSEYSEYSRKRARKEAAEFFEADSEEEASTSSKTLKKKVTKSKKRKQPESRTATTSKKGSNIPRQSGWELDSESDDNSHAPGKSDSRTLQSVLTRRVADGVLRRTANLPGDVFVEVKVYNTKDILTVPPKDRWERALIALKYQGKSDCPELDLLKQLLKLCKGQFKDEGTFFADKKK